VFLADVEPTIDFRRRFLSLLSFKFREFGSVTALSVLEAANSGVKKLDEDASRGSSALRRMQSGGVRDAECIA
jgi:hypothetical protein